jgi:hypothetical protein
MHFQELAQAVASIGPALARLPFFPACPRLPAHRHLKRKVEYYRRALRSRSGDFSFPRSEFRTTENVEEGKVRARSRPTGCKSGAQTASARFQIVLSNVSDGFHEFRRPIGFQDIPERARFQHQPEHLVWLMHCEN